MEKNKSVFAPHATNSVREMREKGGSRETRGGGGREREREGRGRLINFFCSFVCLFVFRSRELRRQQRYHDKSHYQPGVWNVNTVMMGGLGGDPELSSSSDEGTCTCM